MPQGLEVVPPSDPEWTATATEAGSKSGEKVDTAGRAAGGLDGQIDAKQQVWWKRKRILIGIAIVIVVAIALGVGLGVGLTTNKFVHPNILHDQFIKTDIDIFRSSNPAGGEEEQKSDFCGGDICPSILSMTIHPSRGLHLFARTNNNSIAYRIYDDSKWQDWVNLGDMDGGFISQPRGVNWGVRGNFTRLDVFAIGSTDGVVYNRWIDDKEDWEDNDWVSIGENAGSPIVTCSPFTTSLNLWSTGADSDDIIHSQWEQKSDNEMNQEGLDGISSEQGAFSSTRGGRWGTDLDRTSAAVHCIQRRGAAAEFDVVYYPKDGRQATVASWSGRDWSYKSLQEGDWIGNPVLFNNDVVERWDFFGLQSDNQLYHSSWTPDNFPPMNRLGGKLISWPTVVSLGTDSYDVVALGFNGTLQHLNYDGNRWADEWEDLGIEVRSAPSARTHDRKVFLTAVAQNGSLMVWTRDNSTSRTWKDSLQVEDLGGDLSLEFL